MMFYITQLVGVPAPAGFFYVHHSSSSKGSLVQRADSPRRGEMPPQAAERGVGLSAAAPLTEGLSSPTSPSWGTIGGMLVLSLSVFRSVGFSVVGFSIVGKPDDGDAAGVSCTM